MSYVFNDYGRLDIREDCSVHIYNPNKSYMDVPHQDRDAAVVSVRKAWCDDGFAKANNLFIPKIVLRGINTGENLGTYRYFFNW